MYLAVFALTLVCTRAVAATAMSGSVEMQTSYLNSIYEAVKNRQLRDGELNLLRNESMGFANAVRSFAEKGEKIARCASTSVFPSRVLTYVTSGEKGQPLASADSRAYHLVSAS